ncbi:cytochrome P450 family protein [Amycolatopsis palatopharyngis]|uniref:cytochrome P450 family protein n=1 Tax=Amycolatopsis palatopharyngis TaxID=187982 RepID=UPI001FE28ECA|nr:cytochrome P450 [Amycolatopsis palatopharyngis]
MTDSGAGTSETPELTGPQFDRNPSPAYAYLREHSPVHRLPLPGGAYYWLITRYEDALPALTDSRLAKSPAKGNAAWRQSGMGLPLDHRPSLGSHMINADGEKHSRLRKLVAGAFAPRRMERLRRRAQAVTDDLLDQIEPRAQADLVRDLAFPLPICMISDLLGIPESEREPLQRWVAVLDSSDQDSSVADLLDVTDEIDNFLTGVVDYKRRSPGEDLISDLLRQQRAGLLTNDELTSMAFLLLVGGHETTVALIGNATLALLMHPEQADGARVDPNMVSQVVEESLRIDSPTQNATWRFPLEPVTIGGQLIQPGDPILVSLLAANRDPAHFADPDTFNLMRSARHIAFGAGPHVCIGAALARLEGQVAVGTVFRRFSELALAVPTEQLRWWPSPIMRGLYSLPVVF